LRYQDYVTSSARAGNTMLGTFGWQKDGSDSLLMTTKGVYRRAVLEAALPGARRPMSGDLSAPAVSFRWIAS
jgi:outer membrane protein assembly factor BamA